MVQPEKISCAVKEFILDASFVRRTAEKVVEEKKSTLLFPKRYIVKTNSLDT